MNEQKIEELKNALREVMQFIAQRNAPLDDNLRAMLVRIMEHVANRIQELRQEENPADQLEPSINIPELTEAMPSSNIHSFNYDYDNGNLLVKFQGDGAAGQGPIYSYGGVQPYIFNLFRQGSAIAKTTGKNKWGKWWKGKTPSIGAAMAAFIKNGGYPYQRII